jgi:hypothetical protein
MKYLATIGLASSLLATPVYAGNDVKFEFKKFTGIAAEYTGLTVDYEYCNKVTCGAEIGPRLINLLWPDGGWVVASTLPSSGRMDEMMLLCASAVEYVTELGPDGSALMARRLFAGAEGEGAIRFEVGSALLSANKTSSGIIECDARRKSPIQ